MQPDYHSFDAVLARVISREGGFILHNVPLDRGGDTYAGITRKSFPNWVGWGYIKEGDFAKAKSAASDLYLREFWDKIQGNELRRCGISPGAVMDFAVNAGLTRAVKFVQRIARVEEDGVLGPHTLQALSRLTSELFELRFHAMKVEHYATICNADREQSKFLLGWLNRCLSVQKYESWSYIP